jgi:hypothetical protein
MKGNAKAEVDADSFPIELELKGSDICIATFSWMPVPHGRQEPDKEDLYFIGRACLPLDEFKQGILNLLERFHRHLRDLYAEARDNPALESLVQSLKQSFSGTPT